MIDVSVVIPCHNAEPWLRQTLRSLLAQSHPPLDVVVVDDRSTDRSVEVARSFGGSVRVLTADFGNAAQTRNHGAAMVSGNAIMFMDADDVVGPEVIASLARKIERHPEGIAACPWYRLERVDGHWVRRPPSCAPRRPGQDVLDAWLRGWYHPPCSVLWSRAAWERVEAWDPRCSVNDDGDIMMRAFALGVSLHLTSGGEAFYRRMPEGGESLSGRGRTKDGLEARLYVVVKIARLLRASGQLGRHRHALGRALNQILWDAEGDFPEIASSCRSYRKEFGEASWLRIGRGLMARVQSLRRAAPEFATRAHRGPEDEIRHGLEGTVVKPDSSKTMNPPDDPVVSVVVPTFNRASLLPRTLESVLAQTFGAFEVLVVDDGSEDDTPAVVAQMEDPRVRYLALPENRGVAAARNHGLTAARGEFIAFLDSDDEWLPEKLERQVERFRAGPPELGLVYTGVQDLYERGGRRVRHPSHRGDLYETLLLSNVVHGGGSNVMIRRAVANVVGGFDETLPAIEDFDYWLRIARHFTIDFVPDVLLTYHDPVGRGERKSLNVEENLAAREAFYRKHRSAMRKAGVAHRFLLETARRTHELKPTARWRARHLALRALAHRPFWGHPWRLLAGTLPEVALQPLRRLRNMTTNRG